MIYNEYRCLNNKFYPKGIPGYPDPLFFNLIKHGWLTETDVVANIASGTGRFAELISHCADTVYAIEPNKQKLAGGKARFMNRDNIVSVLATAENTTLENNSVDVVVVTEAFDLLDRQLFKQECERILKPGGRVVIVWNEMDISQDIIKVLSAFNSAYSQNFRAKNHGFTYEPKPMQDFFFGHYYSYQFPNVIKYDLITFLANILSSEYAPNVEEPHFYDYVCELQKIFERFEKDKVLNYPYITRCYIGLMDDHIESSDLFNKANIRKRPRKRSKPRR